MSLELKSIRDRALIGRDWYDITAWHLSADGRCAKCGTPCPGVFEATAGQWGPRRQPVRAASIRSRTVGEWFYLNGSAPSNRRLLQPSQRQLPAAAIEWPCQTEDAEAGRDGENQYCASCA